MCEACSKLKNKETTATSLTLFFVFIINFEQISHIVLVFSSLTLNKLMPAGIPEILKFFIKNYQDFCF